MLGVKTIVIPTLLAAAGAYAAPFQKRGMEQVISQCNHNFAYTFDDGPYQWNTELVNKFNSVGGKATFFVNGNNWGCIYSDANVQALRYAFEQGHQIASHTWSHPHLTQLSEAQIDEEIQRLDEAFVKILGVKPKFLRPPYGDIDERTASYIQSKHGKTIVLWDQDSGDTWAGANEQGSIDFYRGLAAEGPDSKHLPLSHEVWEYAVRAAENGAVDALHDAGITLLTTAQCLDMDPYEIVGGYGVKDSTWTCQGTWTPPSTPTPSSSSTTIQTPTDLPSSTVSTAPTSTPPACKQTYTSVAGDTCATIEDMFNLVEGTIKTANAFLTCTDIWAWTPICIPDGPYKSSPAEPSCVTQNYQSLAGETCSSIETKFALKAGSVSTTNTWVNCADIWTNTNLSICVPTLSASDPQTCTKSITAATATTCAAVGAANGVSAAWIKAWNPWLNCADIWQGTNLCVAH